MAPVSPSPADTALVLALSSVLPFRPAYPAGALTGALTAAIQAPRDPKPPGPAEYGVSLGPVSELHRMPSSCTLRAD